MNHIAYIIGYMLFSLNTPKVVLKYLSYNSLFTDTEKATIIALRFLKTIILLFNDAWDSQLYGTILW